MSEQRLLHCCRCGSFSGARESFSGPPKHWGDCSAGTEERASAVEGRHLVAPPPSPSRSRHAANKGANRNLKTAVREATPAGEIETMQ